MNELDKKILNCIQEGIPINKDPFLDIANILEIDKKLLIERLQNLKKENIIRRFGAVIDVNKAGIVSSLAGIKVSDSNITQVADFINRYDEVTHNYQRESDYNIWFTIMASSDVSLNEIFNEVLKQKGVEKGINLKSEKKYKTKVIFEL